MSDGVSIQMMIRLITSKAKFHVEKIRDCKLNGDVQSENEYRAVLRAQNEILDLMGAREVIETIDEGRKND